MKWNRLSLTIAGGISMLGWLFLFGAGLLVNSEPYRTAVGTSFTAKAFMVSILTYTPTNVALLTMAAALCGGCSSGILASTGRTKKPEEQDSEGNVEVWSEDGFENPVASIIRGFVVYVAFLGGVYISTDQPFAHASPEQYARTAGAISLLAFLVGFDQAVFRNLLKLGTGKGKGG